MNKYESTAIKLVDKLTKYVDDRGRVIDPITNEETPLDHYCYTNLATSSFRAYHITSDKNYLDISHELIDRYNSIPKREHGHKEFNLLALAELYELTFGENPNLREKIKPHIIQQDFTTSKDIPRNWKALRAHFMKIIEDRGVSPVTDPEEIVDEWLTWLGDDDLFVDYESDSHDETPLTYHAMHTALLLEYGYKWNHSDALNVALDALDGICNFILKDGEALYWGRSNNSLFGYVHLLFALELGDAISNKNYYRYKKKVWNYLNRLRTDGEFTLTPGSSKIKSAGWDGYMYHTVYNSITANILFKTPESTKDTQDRPALSDPECENFIIKRTSPQTAIHLKSQTRHGKRDPRGAGFVPLVFKTRDGRDLLPTLPSSPQPEVIPKDFVPISPFLPIIRTNSGTVTPLHWKKKCNNKVNESIRHAIGTGIFTRNPTRMGNSIYSVVTSNDIISKSLERLGAKKLLQIIRDTERDSPISIQRNILTGTINGDSFVIIDDEYSNLEYIEEIYPYSFPVFSGMSIETNDNTIQSNNWSAVLEQKPIESTTFKKYDTSKGDMNIELIECESPRQNNPRFSQVFGPTEMNCHIFRNDDGLLSVEFQDKSINIHDGKVHVRSI